VAGHSSAYDYSLYEYFKRDSCNTGILLCPGRNIILVTSCALVEADYSQYRLSAPWIWCTCQRRGQGWEGMQKMAKPIPSLGLRLQATGNWSSMRLGLCHSSDIILGDRSPESQIFPAIQYVQAMKLLTTPLTCTQSTRTSWFGYLRLSASTSPASTIWPHQVFLIALQSAELKLLPILLLPTYCGMHYTHYTMHTMYSYILGS